MKTNTVGVTEQVESIIAFKGRYAFLSNFYLSPIHFKGWTYPTVEHAYQASKCTDVIQRVAIRHAASASLAKRLGNKCTIRADWNNIKLQVMKYLVWQKFVQNESLRHMLISTYPAHLIEGNTWHDYYWGVCQGRGINHLGEILMQVRVVMMKGEGKTP